MRTGLVLVYIFVLYLYDSIEVSGHGVYLVARGPCFCWRFGGLGSVDIHMYIQQVWNMEETFLFKRIRQ